MENTERICTTGWHCLCQGHELRAPYHMEDAAPLDAPYWIPCGASIRGPYTGRPIGVSNLRGE